MTNFSVELTFAFTRTSWKIYVLGRPPLVTGVGPSKSRSKEQTAADNCCSGAVFIRVTQTIVKPGDAFAADSEAVTPFSVTSLVSFYARLRKLCTALAEWLSWPSKLWTSASDPNANAPERRLARIKRALRARPRGKRQRLLCAFADTSAQMNTIPQTHAELCGVFFVCFFSPPTENCWQRARRRGWNEHGCVPPVNAVLCTRADARHPGPYIYSPSCVHLCMFVCEARRASVWIWEPCRGVRQDAARGRKSPAAFGLVSASRKPSTMLHARYPKDSPCGRILYIFYFRAGWGHKRPHWFSSVVNAAPELTCRRAGRAIRLICANFPGDVASRGSHATRKLTNLSVFRGKKNNNLKLLCRWNSICVTVSSRHQALTPRLKTLFCNSPTMVPEVARFRSGAECTVSALYDANLSLAERLRCQNLAIPRRVLTADPDQGGARCCVTGDLPVKLHNSVCSCHRSEEDLGESIKQRLRCQREYSRGRKSLSVDCQNHTVWI